MSLSLDWVKSTLEFGERHCVAVWLLTAIVLFIPSQVLAPIGIAPLVSQYRQWIGLFFLLTTLILLSRGIRWVSVQYMKSRAARVKLHALRQRLHRLTPEEKAILRYYVARNTKTQRLSLMDGVVAGLERERVIFKASQAGHFDS